MLMPPLDRNWTWQSWEAAQRDADPWKKPNSMSELALIVQRGLAAKFRSWEMEEALQIPFKVIVSLSETQRLPDPWRDELNQLNSLLRTEITFYQWANKPLSSECQEKLDRFMHLRNMTWHQITNVISVADSETVEGIKKTTNQPRDYGEIVEIYFNLLQDTLDGVVAFPPLGEKGSLSPRIVADEFQEISAILSAEGLKWLSGYSPAGKGGDDTLAEVVLSQLDSYPKLAASLDEVAADDSLNSNSTDRVFTPVPKRSSKPPGSAVVKRPRPQWDRCASDAANAALGKAGEDFVVRIERCRLTEEGRADLAKNVVWTSVVTGDGAGYDVSSFNADGSARLIEVKTTKGDQATPFYVTANEVRVSRDRPDEFWLYRVYNFSDKVNRKVFCLQGALDAGDLTLTPTTYRAVR